MDDDDAPAAAAAPDAASASTAAWSADAIAAAASFSSASGPARFVLNLPPGYHFLPTNAELVLHYLRPRLANHRLPLPIFFDEHILHYHPDRLIAASEKYREYGEDRWFFFTRRERKHAGGSRPNRATPDNGHWNATGCPKRICGGGGELVGRMRTLVFYEAPRTKKKKMRSHGEAEAAVPPMPPPAEEGEASKGAKTEWTMYEYESIASEEEFLATGVDGKMDAIVLCTIQKKKQKKKEEEEGNEGETTKKRTRGKAKEKGHEQAVPADAEQGSCAGGKTQATKKRRLTAETHEEDHVQRTLTETEEALERELALEAFTGVANFTVDSNASMPRCFFANTSPSPLPTLPLDTMTMASAARGDNHNHHISAHPSTAAMENYSQFRQFQAPASGQELLIPYFHTKILAPPAGGGNNSCSTMAPRPSSWMDGHFASNQTELPPPPLPLLGASNQTAPPLPPLLREVSAASWIYTPHTTPYNTTKIVPAADLYGFAPGLSNSNPNYGFAGDGHRLSAGFGGRLDLLGLSSFPLQPSFGAGSGSSTQGGAAVHSKLSVEGWRFLFDTQGSSAPKAFGPMKK
ncbi:unnamed protein product [Urochloa decumbens]|uniref:NAC domain-containing protein n=1 Tax=Urochloa decumbens TaxID=240449 RepID=A0ABC8YD04_9POAL